MRDSHFRPFTLADALLLVAATAIGFGVDRIPGWILFPDLASRSDSGWHLLTLVQVIGPIQLGSVPLLVAWTIAFLAIRLRRPRPALRVCLREPGMVGCCAATVGIVINGFRVIAMALAYSPAPAVTFYYRGNDVQVYAVEVGFTVIGSWVGLVLVRGWRPRPCWIDRLGRALGMLWVAMIGVYLASYLIHAFSKYW